MIYELITPSDAITYLANDDKIACVCALILGNGAAGCKREDGESIPSMYIFDPEPMPKLEKYLGCELTSFIDSNRKQLSQCFSSFAHGSIEERKEYDKTLSSITDPDKLIEFKKKHEDKNRTSLSTWVKNAWKYAEWILVEEKKEN